MASRFNHPPTTRADVQELHQAWKRAFGFDGHRFRGPHDFDAQILAEAIDANGLDDCLLVAKWAKDDDMVSGRTDERKAKHESIRYIFGNTQALARILKLAKQRDQSHGAESMIEHIARLRREQAE